MMELSISQLGTLFPAFVLVDGNAVVLESGPSLNRRLAALVPGEFLFDHLRAPEWERHPDLDYWADNSVQIQLHSINSHLVLAGAALRSGNRYLLALNHVPAMRSLSELSLNIADFAYSDPIAAAYLQIGVLQGLLEETKDNAMELVKERQRGIELVNRIKSSASILAHDYNNLNSIIELNCTNAMKAGDLSVDQEHRIRVINDSIKRSIETTKALTIVAKQKNDSGLAEDIDDLIRENWPYFRMIAGPRVTLLDDLGIGPFKAQVSRNGLVNSLTSLLMNAREALFEPTGSIKIVSHADPASGEVVIEVIDKGVGMEANVLLSAFDAFFSTKESGHGMGLTSVRDFAREMGGDADIVSAPGEGTQVRIRLPMKQASSGGFDAMQTLVGSAQAADLQAPSDVSILIVEDEPDALEALSELLADIGYQVASAMSAGEALTELGQRRFDVLLCDVVMPGTDGLAVATEVCRLHPGQKVILMSGYMPEFLEMRPDWLFIRKPLDLDALHRLIAAPSPELAE